MRLEEMERQQALSGLRNPSVLTIDGHVIATDKNGYLLDHNDWSPLIAETLAQRDGVTLEEDHWILIDFLHRFYAEFEIAPEMPVLARNLCKDKNDCRWSKKYINGLFPEGARSVCRYAGLPMPVGRGCF